MKKLTLSCIAFWIAATPAWAAVQDTKATPVSAKTGADVMPASTSIYIEWRQPKAFLDLVLDHPLRKKVEAMKGVAEALEGPKYLQFNAILAAIEAQIGLKWRPALGALTEGGIYFGLDMKTNGLALVVRPGEEETLTKVIDTFIKMARDDAENKGNDDPVETYEYRETTVYRVDQARFGTFGGWFVLTNNKKLGKQIADRCLDGGGDTLAGNERFRTARGTISGKPTLWAYADVATMRAGGFAKQLYSGKTDNPGAELLFGGLLGTLQETPFATGSLYLESDHLRLALSTPHKPKWIGEAREYFFGPGGKAPAPGLLQVKNTILALSTYRNFSEMWLRAGDLFEDDVAEGMAQAESGLSTLFSGKDFAEDILGAFKPEVQFVAARQEFGDKTPQPAIKLPAFALVFRFKEPDKARADFRRTFTSLIGFINVTGAMNGQPQLDLDFETVGDHKVITATYVPEEDEKDTKEGKINFNFSPSVAFVGDRFIVCSTKGLARELAGASTDAQEPATKANTHVRADLAALRKVLEDNRRHLVSQNMLEEGNSKEEAEGAIGAQLAILELLRGASLGLKADDDTLSVELRIDLVKSED